MAQSRNLLNNVNSLSDGATHVPDQISTILSSRTLPRCGSGLPRNAQNCAGIMGNVFERPPVQKGQSSTVFNRSKNLASSSQGLRPDITEKAGTEIDEKGIVEHIDRSVESYWWNFFSRRFDGSSESSWNIS